MANQMRATRVRSRRARCQFLVEALEPRCLLAAPIVEFPVSTGPADPWEIVSGLDGNLWFTDLAFNKVGQLNPTTHAIVEFNLPTPDSRPNGITLGPDGNLWFTESHRGWIGQINPTTHAIAEFDIPTNSASNAITTGPDGNIWFTGFDHIGMINPLTHVIADLPLPFRFSAPQGITTGPDGNLWFTERNTFGTGPKNIIGMIDPTTHAITEFNFPAPSEAPNGSSELGQMTAGSDGTLWFAEGIGQIGQINTTTHIISEYVIPASLMTPHSITTGPDGNLWFTGGFFGQVVGQINPTSHIFTTLPIPTTNSLSQGITTGPDGNLWFTEPRVGKIAEIQIAGPRMASSIQLTPSANPALLGKPVTFTAIVNATGTGIPTGNITFSIDGVGQLAVRLSMVNNQEQASFTTSALMAGTHTLIATYSGDRSFASSNAQLVNTVVEAPRIATATQLVTTINPSQFGQPITITAIVTSVGTGTPTGAISFSIDGVGQLAVRQVMIDNQDQASFTTSILTAGRHTIAGTYSGDRNFAGSSSQLTVTVFEDGPTITNLQRFGVHAQSTTLLLTFDKPLDPTRAQNVNNYLLVGPNHKRIRIRLAQYHPTALTVNLFPAQRLNLHRSYRLTVGGTGPTGLTDTHGNLLDGARTGQPGSNYIATIDIHTLTAAHVRTRRRQA